MLVGTPLDRSYDSTFSDACLQRMDSGLALPPSVAADAPVAAGTSAAGLAASALAWLVLVLALSWPLRTRLVAAVPSLLVLATAAQAGWTGVGQDSGLSLLWWGSADLAAAAVAVALFVWHPELGGRRFCLLMVVLWGLTSFSFLQQAGDFSVMMAWSTTNWDVPPGTGTLTVARIAAAGVLTAVAPFWLRDTPPVRPVGTVPLRAAGH
jgi:hypothetical protein